MGVDDLIEAGEKLVDEVKNTLEADELYNSSELANAVLEWERQLEKYVRGY